MINMAIININDIPTENRYEGYLWMSDKKNPEIYDDKTLDVTLLKSANPFVVEGCLVDKIGKRSLMIKQQNGIPIVYCYTLTEDDDANAQCYISARMDGRKLRFAQRWRENQGDEYCLGMPVFEAVERVFLGFSK